MATLDIIKDNPIKVGVSAVTAVVMVISTAFTVDSRYVHAEDFKQQSMQHTIQMKQYRVEQRLMIDDLRKKQLEDKLFELEFKDKKTQLDIALIERYKRELDSVEKRINSNNRLQNSLPPGE
jgi:hypothetical protein